MIYRNRNFVKRDYEYTNVVACVADECPASPDGRWVEADDSALSGLTKLYVQGDVSFYGYL